MLFSCSLKLLLKYWKNVWRTAILRLIEINFFSFNMPDSPMTIAVDFSPVASRWHLLRHHIRHERRQSHSVYIFVNMNCIYLQKLAYFFTSRLCESALMLEINSSQMLLHIYYFVVSIYKRWDNIRAQTLTHTHTLYIMQIVSGHNPWRDTCLPRLKVLWRNFCGKS